MKNKINLIILTLIISISLNLGSSAAVQKVKTPVKAPAAVQKTITQNTECSYEYAKPLEIVANPAKYLNKHVKIKAKFNKFSTLGLDYQPAYKSSEKYISFLIKRDDTPPGHTIPLSEMKNFILREEAEKYIDLAAGDEIEYCGTVFSNALGDVWINVEKFTVLNQASKPQNSIKK